jgi:nicotinate-nucleotide pyrophosphorylase
LEDAFPKIKITFNVEVSWKSEEGWRIKVGNFNANFEDNLKDLQKAHRERLKYVKGVRSGIAKVVSDNSNFAQEFLLKGKDAVIHKYCCYSVLQLCLYL